MAKLLCNAALNIKLEIKTNSRVDASALLLLSTPLYIVDCGSHPAPHHSGIAGDFTSHTIKPTPIPLSGGPTSAASMQAEEKV